MSAWAVVGTTVLAATAGGATGYLSQRAAASHQAKVDYTANARKRLYEAIGPLRFQLLIACRDVERRITLHLRINNWVLDPHQYFGKSFIYRLLRPLAICILVERQMSYSDFSVDKSSVELLRFNTAAYRMLSTEDPLPYYRGLDFTTETQHIFSDNLQAAAACLLTTGVDGHPVVMGYADFAAAYPDLVAAAPTASLARWFQAGGGTLVNLPVLWVRLVGYGYLCQRFMAGNGADLGFGTRPFETQRLIGAVQDEQILNNLAAYPAIFDGIIARGL